MLLDIVNSLLHLGFLGHVHVDHMEPLRTLGTELHGSSLLWVQDSSKHRESRLVETLGDGVPEPGVAAGDDHRATCRIEHLLRSSRPEDEQGDADDANHGKQDQTTHGPSQEVKIDEEYILFVYIRGKITKVSTLLLFPYL